MYSVRQMDVDDKVSQHVTMDIFAHIYAPETREKLLQEQRAQEPKERRLRDVVPGVSSSWSWRWRSGRACRKPECGRN